jgi:hypothetical protein
MQNQAKAALLFLYKEVLAVELPWLDIVEQANSTLSDYMYALPKTVIPAWIAGIQAPGMVRSSPPLALYARFPAGMTDFLLI